MNRLLASVFIILLTTKIQAQEIPSKKYWDLFGTKGVIVTEEEFKFETFAISRENIDTGFRVVSAGSSKLKFLSIGYRARIEQGDLTKLIDAISKLKATAEPDKAITGKDIERFFETEDGFKVGYKKGSGFEWYFKYKEESGSKTIDIIAFEGLLIKAKAKLVSL